MSENKTDNLNLQWARYYTKARGWSVIPLSPGAKIPPKGFDVITYRTRIASEEELSDWFSDPKMNIGIITGELSNLFVVDLDKSKPHYQHENAVMYFGENPDTIIADTPSGGRHLYYTYPGHKITIASNVLPAIDYRGEGGYVAAPPSMNGNGKAYTWLHGLGDSLLNNLNKSFLEYILINSKYGVCSKPQAKDATESNIYYKILQDGSRDDDLFHIANCLIKGNCDPQYAQQVLEILANNCVPPFPSREISIKIESALKRAERRERNLADEVREWCLLQEGYFLTTDILQTLQITTKEEKKNLTVILTRLKSEGIIESYGEKRGSYRLVKRETTQMQFIDTPVNEFDVKLGFGINDVCKIFPKNIIIVAGTKSSGKTALLMKWALDNQDRYPVVYLNSEMGDEEYSERLKSFGIKQSSDIRMSSYNCHKNFHDFISDEQKIFIIDFMEVHEDFAQIASYIRKVHEKLRNGICIIAVQKKAGAAFGRGAEFSMEKSRLYINLDFLQNESCTQLTLTDVKTPRYNLGYDHPRGKYKRIKILGGSKMTSLDQDWRS